VRLERTILNPSTCRTMGHNAATPKPTQVGSMRLLISKRPSRETSCVTKKTRKTNRPSTASFPDTSYWKPKEEGRQHSCECTGSHRKQPINEQKENHEAGMHRLILALSNEGLVPPNGPLSGSLA
jgi:hypothetical protein